MGLALAVGVLFVALLWVFRHDELFKLSVRDGRVLVVGGRAPARFVGDVRDIVERARVSRATIRAVKTERGGRLILSGDLDEGTAQRLRNVFGLTTAAQLANAPAIKNPTLGQVLGVAWLAWLLDRSMRD